MLIFHTKLAKTAKISDETLENDPISPRGADGLPGRLVLRSFNEAGSLVRRLVPRRRLECGDNDPGIRRRGGTALFGVDKFRISGTRRCFGEKALIHGSRTRSSLVLPKQSGVAGRIRAPCRTHSRMKKAPF